MKRRKIIKVLRKYNFLNKQEISNLFFKNSEKSQQHNIFKKIILFLKNLPENYRDYVLLRHFRKVNKPPFKKERYYNELTYNIFLNGKALRNSHNEKIQKMKNDKRRQLHENIAKFIEKHYENENKEINRKVKKVEELSRYISKELNSANE